MVALGYVLAFDRASGNIGSPDPEWDFTIAFVWWALILPLLFLFPKHRDEKQALVALWVVRLGVTLGFMLFYEANYGLDAYGYFQRGMTDPDAWRDFRFGEGTTNMAALASVHASVIPQSYHAMKVTSAAIGLLAVFAFYKAGSLLLRRRDVNLLYLLGLFPSILFWGSILGKDPITLLGIGLFVLGVIGFFRSRAGVHIAVAAAGVLIAASIRTWLGMILLFPISVFFVAGQRRFARKVVLGVIAIPALVISLNSFQERFQIETAEELVERTDKISGAWTHGGSGQEVEGFGSIPRMVAFMPLGAFTALFRPLPGEVMNAFGLLASVENVALLVALVWIVRTRRWRRLRSPEALWLIVTVLVWAAIYGFVSYQNLGTAVRFKVQVTPIIVLLVALAFYPAPVRTPAKPRSSGEPAPAIPPEVGVR